MRKFGIILSLLFVFLSTSSQVPKPTSENSDGFYFHESVEPNPLIIAKVKTENIHFAHEILYIDILDISFTKDLTSILVPDSTVLTFLVVKRADSSTALILFDSLDNKRLDEAWMKDSSSTGNELGLSQFILNVSHTVPMYFAVRNLRDEVDSSYIFYYLSKEDMERIKVNADAKTIILGG
jgi:hypothetical protein